MRIADCELRIADLNIACALIRNPESVIRNMFSKSVIRNRIFINA